MSLAQPRGGLGGLYPIVVGTRHEFVVPGTVPSIVHCNGARAIVIPSIFVGERLPRGTHVFRTFFKPAAFFRNQVVGGDLVSKVKVRLVMAVSFTGIGVSGTICVCEVTAAVDRSVEGHAAWNRIGTLTVASLKALQNSIMLMPKGGRGEIHGFLSMGKAHCGSCRTQGTQGLANGRSWLRIAGRDTQLHDPRDRHGGSDSHGAA